MMDPVASLHIVSGDADAAAVMRRMAVSSSLRAHIHESGRVFLDAERAAGPSCAIVDAALPDIPVALLQEEMRRHGRDLPTIIIARDIDVSAIVHAIKAGAVDYLHWPCDERRLRDAIGEALGRDAALRKSRTFITDVKLRLLRLTCREREVLDAIVVGFPNKRIAVELGISEKTVEAHRARVKEKLNAAGVADLVRMVIVAGEHPQSQENDYG